MTRRVTPVVYAEWSAPRDKEGRAGHDIVSAHRAQRGDARIDPDRFDRVNASATSGSTRTLLGTAMRSIFEALRVLLVAPSITAPSPR